jgi:hypothetical protein
LLLHFLSQSHVIFFDKDRGWVVRPQLPTIDGKRLLVKLFCLLVSPLVMVEPRQIIETTGGVGVLVSPLLLVDCERPLEQWLRLSIPLLILVKSGQIAQTNGLMIWLDPCAGYLEDLFEEMPFQSFLTPPLFG